MSCGSCGAARAGLAARARATAPVAVKTPAKAEATPAKKAVKKKFPAVIRVVKESKNI